MTCLLVLAHPLQDSLCAHLAAKAEAALRRAGHEVRREDLYASGFAPALTAAERQSYGAQADGSAVAAQIARLQAAQMLVLCFPTWWSGMPAMLKGWFDRVWLPGVAFDPPQGPGLIRPRLTGLQQVLVITTRGGPWWADRLVMGQPVRRMLKTAILRPCAPQARFDMVSLYRAESADAARLARFEARIAAILTHWPPAPPPGPAPDPGVFGPR